MPLGQELDSRDELGPGAIRDAIAGVMLIGLGVHSMSIVPFSNFEH
jgi:hypothetical protein